MALSLKTKFNLGIAALFILLLVLVNISTGLLRKGNREVEAMLRNNYDSVSYCRVMLQALDRLQEENRTVDAVEMGKAVSTIEANLKAQAGNITEPGEAALTHELELQWSAYKDGRVRLARPMPGAAEPLRRALWAVADINFKNMAKVEGRAQQVVRRAERWMLALLGMGIVLSALLMSFTGRMVLQPIRALTRSVKEVARGNLDLAVQVRSRDELGDLAEAFNTMAGRLREFRRSDRAHLARVEQGTQQAIDSLPDAVAILNTLGRVELANPLAERLFSLKPGVSLENPGLQRWREGFQKALSGAQPVRSTGYGEALQVFDNGEERFFLARCLPLMDAGEPVGVTLVLVDVTGLRKLDELKSGLLSTVAHELRTPLTSLRMATHLLSHGQAGELSPKQEELAGAAWEEGERLHQIVEKFLDLSRLESGGGLLELKPLPAHELAGSAAQTWQAAFAAKGVKLLLEADPALPPVAADPARLDHVFRNLLSNALRFSSPGSEVVLAARAEGAGVRFSVADHGPGIPAEHRARVFEKFYRVPGQAGHGGAGLGLAIAREIVELHHGRLELECPPQGGSEFRFTLPVVDDPTTALRSVPS